MATQHTTPWKFEIIEHMGCTSYINIDTQGGEFGKEAEINLSMINAAPDLLTAAEKAFELLDSVAFVSKPGDSDQVVNQLIAAIKKAKAK